MSDTTNISDLPQGGNITLETKELVKAAPQPAMIPQPQMQSPMGTPIHRTQNAPMPTMSESTLNQIVSGIQSAGASNMTQLPSRDIPMQQHQHTQDPASKPNYIPPPPKQDYIQDHNSLQSMFTMSQKKEEGQDRLDAIYEEAQTPVFVMILFLIFQLPSFQRILQKYIPGVFAKDGGPNFSAYLFKTVLFGGSFYIMQKGVKYLSKV